MRVLFCFRRNNEQFPTSTGIRTSKAPPARAPVTTAAVRRTTIAPSAAAPARTTTASVPAARKSLAPRRKNSYFFKFYNFNCLSCHHYG